MRNTYSPWGELTAQPWLTLEWVRLPSRRLGEYVHQLGLIRLDPRMPRRQARSVLCHELRHHEYGDVGTTCAKAEAFQELRADTNAARLLIDIKDLADAMVLHDEHRSAVAVELRVSLAILDVRLGHLHPAENHLLVRRLSSA